MKMNKVIEGWRIQGGEGRCRWDLVAPKFWFFRLITRIFFFFLVEIYGWVIWWLYVNFNLYFLNFCHMGRNPNSKKICIPSALLTLYLSPPYFISFAFWPFIYSNVTNKPVTIIGSETSKPLPEVDWDKSDVTN